MPMPRPRVGEAQNKFINRCMASDIMQSEYSDGKQRLAVCYSQWRRKEEEVTPIFSLDESEIIKATQHRCRLEDPAGFKKGSYKSYYRTSGGKRYQIIAGRKKGETSMTEQAYGYDPGVWNKASAQAHCKRHKGSFTAGGKETSMVETSVNLLGELRKIIIMPKGKDLAEVITMGEEIAKAATTNTPAWGTIAHNQADHPNKSDFIVQRGDTWSEWKLPYKYKGKIHCGGVRAASAMVGGARAGKPMSLTAVERKRLNAARSACGIGKTLEEELAEQGRILPEYAESETDIHTTIPQTGGEAIVAGQYPELENVDVSDILRDPYELEEVDEDDVKQP